MLISRTLEGAGLVFNDPRLHHAGKILRICQSSRIPASESRLHDRPKNTLGPPFSSRLYSRNWPSLSLSRIAKPDTASPHAQTRPGNEVPIAYIASGFPNQSAACHQACLAESLKNPHRHVVAGSIHVTYRARLDKRHRDQYLPITRLIGTAIK